jgi:hypothetical protein
MNGTAWTHDDLYVNLREEVLMVRGQYGVPSIDFVPDFELTPVREAQLGDIVPVGKHVGIVYDIEENRGVRELSIVLDSLRVVMKRVSA